MTQPASTMTPPSHDRADGRHRVALCLFVLVVVSMIVYGLIDLLVSYRFAHADSALISEGFLGISLPVGLAVIHSRFRMHFTPHQIGRELSWLAVPIVLSLLAALLRTNMTPLCALYGAFPEYARSTAVFILWVAPLLGVVACESQCKTLRDVYQAAQTKPYPWRRSVCIFVLGLSSYAVALAQMLTRVYI